MNTKYYYNRISLPKHIDDQIQFYKMLCFTRIGKFGSMNSEAHISFNSVPLSADLGIFNISELDLYYNKVRKGLSNTKPFKVNIVGFSALHHGENKRTLCANLSLDLATSIKFNSVMGILKRCKNFTPHISIARDISLTAFNELWPYFERQNYNDMFTVDRLTVLQQERKEFSSLLPFKVIPFYR